MILAYVVCVLYLVDFTRLFVCYINLIAPKPSYAITAKQKMQNLYTGLDYICCLIAYQACGKTVKHFIFSQAIL